MLLGFSPKDSSIINKKFKFNKSILNFQTQKIINEY